MLLYRALQQHSRFRFFSLLVFRSCLVVTVLTGRGAGARGRRPGLRRRQRRDAPQHPVRCPLGCGAAGHVLRELVRPPAVLPALRLQPPPLSFVSTLCSLRAALATRGSGAGLSVLRVLRADAVGTLAAVAAAAASAAAPAAVTLAVAAHAAAGAVSSGRGPRLGLAFFSPGRLPVLFLRFRPLVLAFQGRDQRPGALSGGARGGTARLTGRRRFAAAAFIIRRVDRVGLRGGWYTFTFRLLVLVRRGGGGGRSSLSARFFPRGVARSVHPALHRQEFGCCIECRAPFPQNVGLGGQ